MKILVPVKRVVDYNVKVRVKPDQSGVELANIKKGIFHSVIGLYRALGGGWSWRE